MPSNSNKAAVEKSRWPQSLASLKEAEFRWLLTSNTIFFLVMQGQFLTRTYLAWELTHEKMALANVNLAVAIPMLFAAIIGGAISDRVERKRLIISGQIILLANECYVLGLILVDSLGYYDLLLASFITGCILPFLMPARTAIIYNIVGSGGLGNAMALSSGTMNLSRVLGPAAIGFILEFYGPRGAYTFSAILYVFAIACMKNVQPCHPALGSRKKSLYSDVAEGFSYALNHRQVLICLLFGLLPMFLVQPFQNLLVLFADEVWHVGERGLGFMLASAGLGGVFGTLYVARRGENPRRVRLMMLSAFCFAGFLIVFSLSANFYWALLPLGLANMCAQACSTLNNTSLQLLVDDSVRGRMSSIMMMSFGLTPLGVLPLAYLAGLVGAPMSIVTACCLLIFSVILFYTFSPTLRRMDRSVRGALREKQSV